MLNLIKDLDCHFYGGGVNWGTSGVHKESVETRRH